MAIEQDWNSVTDYRARYGPHNPDETYLAHEHGERVVDLGEVQLNYATTGKEDSPALLLIPGQTESWWGYEAVMRLLAEHFQVFAVDLRGQGRSTRTPGRYTLDNIGNDLVRFMDLVIQRPAIVSGLSSGGVLSAWLSAYAKPGQVLAAVYEDPPLFSSEVRPAVGPGIRQCIGPLFDLWSTFLGDQWSIGAWDAMRDGSADRLPEHMKFIPVPDEPPQNLREYDPEWGRSFWSGTVAASCDHERMLRSVKVGSVLLTHHMRIDDASSGFLFGAMSDQQAKRAQDLLVGAGVDVAYRSFPDVGHSMHGDRPELYVETLLDWVQIIDH
jgi:pimeloyl-ACP methyl ester carboxylesterase